MDPLRNLVLTIKLKHFLEIMKKCVVYVNTKNKKLKEHIPQTVLAYNMLDINQIQITTKGLCYMVSGQSEMRVYRIVRDW